MAALQLDVLDCGVLIECIDDHAQALLQNIYRCFTRSLKKTKIDYQITPGLFESLLIGRDGDCAEIARSSGDFISKFDKDLIIETQKLRPDLYFVHAAVVGFHDHAIALVAPSGFGKSTTTWGLLHHGFRYLSDEIAPIDPKAFRVLPFPRALCLKKNPPDGYPLPLDVVFTGRTIHIPTSLFPDDPVSEPLPLSIIIFLRFIGNGQPPTLKPIGLADATVRLLINTLNPLAHSQYGIDDAMTIVAKARCFELLTTDLYSTCELLRAACAQDFNHAGTRPDISTL